MMSLRHILKGCTMAEGLHKRAIALQRREEGKEKKEIKVPLRGIRARLIQ
jgi:hypothetical protein